MQSCNLMTVKIQVLITAQVKNKTVFVITAIYMVGKR